MHLDYTIEFISSILSALLWTTGDTFAAFDMPWHLHDSWHEGMAHQNWGADIIGCFLLVFPAYEKWLYQLTISKLRQITQMDSSGAAFNLSNYTYDVYKMFLYEHICYISHIRTYFSEQNIQHSQIRVILV